jgi:hypothetical protein
MNLPWKEISNKFNVWFHHLAYRYKYNQDIPVDLDMMNLCGNGCSRHYNDMERGCINAKCMMVGTRKQNIKML